MTERYRPVDNRQRNKVAGAVAFLLIVQYDSVIGVSFEFNFDAEFMIRFQPVHPDVTFAVKGRYLVISLVDFLIAQQPGVIRPTDADESCAGQVDARRSHMTGIRETRAELLSRRHRHIIG